MQSISEPGWNSVRRSGMGRVADLFLRHIKVVTIAVHKATAGADRQHPAGNAGTDSMKILTGSKKAALAATGLTGGTPVHG